MKAIKYIRLFCFLLCAISIYGFVDHKYILQGGNRIHDYFDYDLVFIRKFLDILMLMSLLVICLKDWMNQDKKYYWACVVFFLFFNFLDTFSWLSQPLSYILYTTPIFSYSLPVLVIIQDILYQKNANYKYPMFGGLALLLIGFLFYYFFIVGSDHYVDDEAFDAYVQNGIIKNWIVYFGYMLSVSGIILMFYNPKKHNESIA